MSKKGLHISFCGVDGSGKTTQARLLHQWMQENSHDVIFHEHSRNFVAEISTSIGRRHGSHLGFGWLGQDYYAVAMSFEILREAMLGIQPYTVSGVTVISPRAIFDTFARSRARGCGEKAYTFAKEIMLFCDTPNLTIWLDAPPQTAYERIVRRGYDHSSLDFLQRLHSALSEICSEYGAVRINAAQDTLTVHKEVVNTVKAIL